MFLKEHGYEYKRIIGFNSFGVMMEYEKIARNEVVGIKVISFKEEEVAP